MPHPSLLRLTQPGCALVLCGLLTCAQAVELGETVVRSHAGQPLVADIELTAFADDGAAVQARLANPDVYRGANIALHPVLSHLRLSVMRRDGRQHLHITSIKPVDADFIHLFLELTEGSRRNVRGTTLWFSPDPNPAPPPVLSTPLPLPLPAPAARARPAELLRLVQGAPGASPQPFSAGQITSCAVLDEKNAVLTAQIAELEAKVRLLQVAIEGKPAALPAAAPGPAAMPAAARGAGPDPAASAGTAGGAFAWLWIGTAGAVVAGIGAVAVVLRRRRQSRPRPEDSARPGFMAGVKQRLMQARAGR